MDTQALPLGDDADDLVGDRPIETAEHDLRQRVLHNPGVRALIGARFIATLGVATLAYGAMVYLATVGASQVTVSRIGATRFFAALLFGIGGGALVDVKSKRTAMVTAYLLMAAACFIVPTLWGTSIPSLLVLVLVVAALGQIAIPAVKAATALGPRIMDLRGECALGVMALTIISLGFVLFGLIEVIATALGPRVIFVVAPPLVVAVVIWLVRVCFRVTDQDSPEARAILGALLEATRTTAPYAPDEPAHRV